MKITKLLVGISKIIDRYDAVMTGFRGVLYDGINVNAEALEALKKCALLGKKVMIVSNSPLRIRRIVEILSACEADLSFLTGIVSAGEVLHYALRTPDALGIGGSNYFNLGDSSDTEIFDGLHYHATSDMAQADFLFFGAPKTADDELETYTHALEQACTLGLPLVCVGNDPSEFNSGKEAVGCGTIAEQYAVLGGKIITLGKPQESFFRYGAESLQVAPERILFVGDSMASDIKGGNLFGADTALVTKGIHVAFLGEGYIPDVAKVRELASHFDAYSDYVLSGLRW
jgi:HAD superfamily hydrolase (TIGR01459 family)